MRFFQLTENVRFSNKKILSLVLPIFLEQIMIAGMGIADTYMVASLGESAVAGVSLVVSIDKLLRQIFVALATGSGIILSQYIGAGDKKSSEDTLLCSSHIVLIIGLIISAMVIFVGDPFLSMMFSSVEGSVMKSAQIYFLCIGSTYFLAAIYNFGTASYHAMGNGKVPLIASVFMMIINLVLKYIFIYIFDWGVAGAGISTAAGMGIVGIALLISMKRERCEVRLKGFLNFKYGKNLIGRIFKVSVPNVIENGMFQFGLVVLQGLIATLGTASIAANGLVNNLTPLMYALGTGFSLTTVVIVGQCMGGGNPNEVSFYFKHILKLDYLFTIINGIIVFITIDMIIPIFGMSAETNHLASKVMHFYIISASLLYPSAMAAAYGLRGIGDTKFVMYISILSMFVLRIAMAYVFVNVFKFGVIGIWYAQGLDWLMRSIMFWGRFLRGKWKHIRLI